MVHDASPPAGASPLLARRDGPTVWLTLNRPRALNALDEVLLSALDRELIGIAHTEDVGAVVITGAGRRAFCFGADLGTLGAGSPEERKSRFGNLLPLFQGIIRRLATLPVPTIAALNGFATGAGFDLALACDLRVASRRAKLGSAFTALGLVPDGGGTYHLPRLIGIGRALELVLTAEPIDAEAAGAIGLVNHVVEPEELEARCGALANRLAAQPRGAVRGALRLLRAAPAGLEDALEAEALEQRERAGSAEFAEALARRSRQRTPGSRRSGAPT